MADHTITLSEGIRVTGPEPTNKWGSMLWGENWLYGDEDLITKVSHLLSDSASLSDEVFLLFKKIVSDSSSLSDQLADLNLKDGAGYSYTFVGGVTDGEDRVETTWSSSSVNSTSWSEDTVTSTTWSEA